MLFYFSYVKKLIQECNNYEETTKLLKVDCLLCRQHLVSQSYDHSAKNTVNQSITQIGQMSQSVNWSDCQSIIS